LLGKRQPGHGGKESGAGEEAGSSEGEKTPPCANAEAGKLPKL